jgi:hypothetical protein
MFRVYVRNLYFGVAKWQLQQLLVNHCGLDEDVPMQVIRKIPGREVQACSMIFTCPDQETMIQCIDTLNSLQYQAVQHLLAPGHLALQANEAYISGARRLPRPPSAPLIVVPPAPKQPPHPPPPHLIAASETATAGEEAWKSFD